MKATKILCGMAAASAVACATAAVSTDEARPLGSTLTPVGAEVAGNKDGSIPAYTGGLAKPPANYTKKGVYVDPYPADKPSFRIDANNIEKYKDRLTPGTVKMIEKYPKTFFIDVYPTRRSAAFPKEYLDNSISNATRCSLTDDGNGIDTGKGCGGGIPFPVPKTGLEALWNKLTRYVGTGVVKTESFDYIKPTGEIVNTAVLRHLYGSPFADPAAKGGDGLLQITRVEYQAPTRLAGNISLITDAVKDSSRRAYAYAASTRRVRLAPDLAADTPISASAGVQLYDDDLGFSGTPERFEWQLVGKEEKIIPYNNYRMTFPSEGGGCTTRDYQQPSHWKADCMRWELHRVWHVVGTLKKGKRHVYSRRELFLDEDSWIGGIAETYDQSSNLYKFLPLAITPMYDVHIPGFYEQTFVDLISGVWAHTKTAPGAAWSVMQIAPNLLAPDSTMTPMLRD